MKYLMKVMIPNEAGNARLRDSNFGMKMQEALKDVKAETVYFTTVSGNRGFYAIVDLTDAAQMPAVAEPFFVWLEAQIDFLPVMTMDDLAKAGPAIESAFKKWG